jgi:type II secretory pathway component PulC
VITGAGAAAAVAVLAEAGKAPLLVPEGVLYSSEFRVEQVQPDHVVLRRQSDGTLITLVPGATPAAPGEAPAEPTLVTPIGELPSSPRCRPPSTPPACPRAPEFTGPALPGPVSGR